LSRKSTVAAAAAAAVPDSPYPDSYLSESNHGGHSTHDFPGSLAPHPCGDRNSNIN
jgi:hypothetical protein